MGKCENVENGFPACDRIVELEADLKQCEPYLKEHETLAQCIARNRKDVVQALKMCASEMKRREELEAENIALRKGLIQAHMAGQHDACVDPSYSNAQQYVQALGD